MQAAWKSRLTRIWREWVKPLLVILVVCGSFRSAVADWNDVPTGSMKPTIVEGDRIFVNKLAYGLRVPFTLWRLMEWEGPQRGDVVVLFEPDTGVRLVKRVIGIPGDRIEMRDNRVIVNGKQATYQPLAPEFVNALPANQQAQHRFAAESLDESPHPVMLMPAFPSKRTYGPVDVPEDEYFVMGDNRDKSRDSRWFGCVERNLIVGHATRIVFSVDPDRHYLPRWNRFFHGLL